MRAWFAALILCNAVAAQAQDITLQPLPQIDGTLPVAPPEAAPREQVTAAAGALLRGLDKVTGEAQDIELENGGQATLGRLEIQLTECRHPLDNPTGDAFAWLEVRDPVRQSLLFQGWMIASSPALNPLDHPRYDVWVLRCTTS